MPQINGITNLNDIDLDDLPWELLNEFARKYITIKQEVTEWGRPEWDDDYFYMYECNDSDTHETWVTCDLCGDMEIYDDEFQQHVVTHHMDLIHKFRMDGKI